MSEMVERVARAICDWQQPGHYDSLAGLSTFASCPRQEDYQALARAAIEAMRTPTDAMIEASYDHERRVFGPLARGLKHSVIFETMIDAALENTHAPT